MLARWQILKEILFRDVLGDFGHLKGNNLFFAFLKEDDPSSVTPNICLLGIPENSILIHADHKLTQPLFLTEANGLQKRCDYILLTKVNGKDTVIFIELKSKSVRNPEVICQLTGGDCLLDFLAAVAEKFKGTRLAFDSNTIARRYVLIYVPDKPSKVLKNKPKPREIHCKPDNYFQYPVHCSSSPVPINWTELVKV